MKVERSSNTLRVIDSMPEMPLRRKYGVDILIYAGNESGNQRSNQSESEQNDDNNGECTFHFFSITDLFTFL